ncbi:phenazine biosynthesis protein PhzF family [Kribbella flavida DSM 17836]|uniref:Phenazine biosynthesis protein PhzF family n=1 Tax=Kribbella flavida (strain DSM 17836 / JCM 10339 / NBRC 14399) TaxID=479435 RepID=D2Q3G5_KRIFD|nr:PhzF family phenazine biosynthesis isomerase [Kribbella flavida]ADB34088.1 phenazine biosynthesis protein PhzF family [Kribbella flavida DSM 17836]
MTILRYSAFSTDPAGGNPAGVVLDARGMDADSMQAIAAEVGYSETAFLTGGPVAGADGVIPIRYFSPEAEVPFCGHATVATAVAVAERAGAGDLVFATPAGNVPVSVETTADGFRATLTSVEPYVEPVHHLDDVLDMLGWRADELDPALPAYVAYAGARHLVLGAATRQRLADLAYDFDRLLAYMRERDLTTLQLVWRESDTVWHVRNPFPVGGVVEDPATGAAAAAFGAYLRELGLVRPPATVVLHQGDDLGRPSVIEVELREGDTRVRVSGTAVPIGT